MNHKLDIKNRIRSHLNALAADDPDIDYSVTRARSLIHHRNAELAREEASVAMCLTGVYTPALWVAPWQLRLAQFVCGLLGEVECYAQDGDSRRSRRGAVMFFGEREYCVLASAAFSDLLVAVLTRAIRQGDSADDRRDVSDRFVHSLKDSLNRYDQRCLLSVDTRYEVATSLDRIDMSKFQANQWLETIRKEALGC